MRRTAAVIEQARARGERSLSEYDSKRVLAAYGVPTTREALVRTPSEAVRAAGRLGYPVVLKACSAGIAHKTERGLVAVGLAGDRELKRAFATLVDRLGGGYRGDFLVQEMVRGSRELMAGMVRDSQFGPCVMFGVGGIFSEAVADVVFRVAPLDRAEAGRMLRGIRGHHLLAAIRGMPAVDTARLGRILIAVGRIGLDHPEVAEIDVNPLIVAGARPVAVDALVVLSAPAR